MIPALLELSNQLRACTAAAREAGDGELVLELHNAGWCVAKAIAVMLKRDAVARNEDVQP